ncbi:hypothetical protein [Methylobacterium frigidaeris]|uniref:Uncharacterized protein n=1 Tax=Methylobacterium frigidaeris TaxID=2038277 RepID=A0AA37HE38_9HYPH|nr:hypothetical protein [Methylobacterium frigidaeris]PIK70173.1 hypothetical protein CS379_26065 [Methylobacterium frigidaeris]GJD63859.1 hypothetical protein MPEAHAMD_4032 [Methylobacterium frigidaeris]
MPAAPATRKRPSLPPESPIAGLIARRRAREAAAERGVFGAAILLALTATGFAGYTLAQPTWPYDVREVLPALSGPFTWKRTVAEARAPEPDLDPLTTGSLAEAPAAPAAAAVAALPERSGPPPSGFALRRAAAGLAVVEGRDGLHEIGVGSTLPGAGRVLSIRSTSAGWIVITTETIIGPTPL